MDDFLLQNLMFPGESYDRHSIKQDATMVIEGVQKTDAGVYVCQAQSIAGTAMAKARLDVKGPSSLLIFIHRAPQSIAGTAMAKARLDVKGPSSLLTFIHKVSYIEHQ